MYELKGEVILYANFLGFENGGFVEALRMLTQDYLLGDSNRPGFTGFADNIIRAISNYYRRYYIKY